MSNILNGIIQTNGLGYVKANVDGIEFNKIKTKSKSTVTPNPVMPVNNGNLWKANNEDLSSWVGINAVDIDWNSAEVEENVIINTTGELLNWIKTKGGQISEIDSEKLAEIQNTIEVYQITFNNVLTKTFADGRYQLKGNYQAAGNYVTSEEYTQDIQTLTNLINTLKEQVNGYNITSLTNRVSVLENAQQSIFDSYASKTYVNEKIAEVVGAAPEALNTLKEIADKLGDNDDAVAALTNQISSKADAENVYSKNEIDSLLGEVQTIKGDKGDQGEQGPQGFQGATGTKGDQGEQGEQGPQGFQGATGAKGDQGEQGEQGPQGFQGATGAKGDQGEQGPQGAQGAQGANGEHGEQGVQGPQGMQGAQGAKGEQGEQGEKGDTGTFDSSELESYATKMYVDSQIAAIVGGEDVSANFDTIKEVADALGDLKVVDVEAVPAVEGEHFTQEEIDAAQEGDEAYGKTVNDWKVEPVEAIEEQSHNMTIGEFVNTSMQAVDEKKEIAKLQTKYNALLTLLNLRDTDVNNVVVNQALATSNNVTFDDGTVDNITVPETTKTTTVTAELDTNSTLNLTSPKGVTINNKGTEATNLTVNAPVEGTSTPTVTLKSGTYDTITVQDASLTVSNDATVQNVVITPETTKSTTINATFVEGATITSNSEAPITVTNKNVEGEEVSVTLNAPGSTVTLSGGKWTTISGEVSENTLIIKGSAKIQSLNLTKGNVIVEVPREEDIQSVISGEITLGEGYSITHRTYEITNENSSKLGGVGEMILQEDLTRTSSIVAPLAPAYNAVWNLNEHNITVTGTPKSGVYLNRYTSNLEVKGTGVIHAEETYGLWNSTTTGKIIVNDGVTVEAQTHAIYAEKGTIEINGGTFKLTDAATADKDQNGNFKFLLNCYDANYKAGTANIIVKGGKFYGFNPAESYGEPNGPVSFVAEGYESVPTNEAYEFGTVYEVRKISQ